MQKYRIGIRVGIVSKSKDSDSDLEAKNPDQDMIVVELFLFDIKYLIVRTLHSVCKYAGKRCQNINKLKYINCTRVQK